MCGSFETLLREATLGWSMIHNLDNSESIGPSSEWGNNRRKRGKLATVNENHARELLELHTVSPSAGYTQNDVVQLSYIMAGWEHRYTKKRLECNKEDLTKKNMSQVIIKSLVKLINKEDLHQKINCLMF